MNDKYTIQDHRDLTTDERILLEWLLENSSEDSSAYSSQLSQVKVVSRCSCGCPSIDLAIGAREKRTTGPLTLIAFAVGYSPEGVEVDVNLHAREGTLSELEIFAHNGTTEFTLPKPESLKPY